MSDPPRVLLIAYDFPPIASAGSHRIVSMAKYLTALGWRVTVLTVCGSFVRQSPSGLERIPGGVEVVRTANFEPGRLIAALYDRVFDARFRLSDDGLREARASRKGRALHFIIAPLRWFNTAVGIPDRKVGWFLPLFFRAWGLLRRGGYDAVLSSSPPHSSQLPVLLLRRLKKFWWVADFRDPWTTPHGDHKGIRRRWLRRIEGLVLARADVVIANTAGNKQALHETFPWLANEKVLVVTNGFDTDEADVSASVDPRVHDADLIYTGYLYRGMLDLYMEAVKILIDSGRRAPRLRVYGPRPLHLRPRAEVDASIEICGRVSYEESIGLMRAARGLLLVLPHGGRFRTCVPSKVYPYVFSGAPVLALVPEGDAARLLSRFESSVVVTSRDAGEVAGAMVKFLKLIDERAGAGAPVAVAELDEFSWKTLATRISHALGGRLDEASRVDGVSSAGRERA